MRIDLQPDDVQLLRDFLRQHVVDLDREISRTDNLEFRQGLRQQDRAIERVLAEISAALEAQRT